MRRSQLDLGKYDSDKIANDYLEYYDPIFERFLEKKITLLELGVYKGGSLLLWRDYFPLGEITGIDIELPKGFQETERIRMFEGSQTDCQFLSRVANEAAPEGFDIIIDDASHIGAYTKTAFWHLFDNHLKADGIYVIEDWGTGYWDDWFDGKSFDLESYSRRGPDHGSLWSRIARKLGLKLSWPCHSHGMVGLVKQLIDEQAAPDVTRRLLKGQPKRRSKFEAMMITPSIVFIKKAGGKPG